MDIWEDSDARKNYENVFNEETLKALLKLSEDGYFDILHGFVKDGKESKVCVAERFRDDEPNTFLAAKIYTIEASSYENMRPYLLGDPRFKGIKKNRRSIVFNWCTKEFKNLKRAEKAGITVPTPVAFNKNVLLMEFLGEDFRPAPRLESITLENPEYALDTLIDVMDTLWNKEQLVHSDLSAFNVLVWQQHLYTIDFSQAVLTHHPRAEEFLTRDINNVLHYFETAYNIDRDPDRILEQIIGE